MENNLPEPTNFLQRIVVEDIKTNAYSREICTRFPPEPNGYLHIGSAYAINISYQVAKKYGGKFNLRFDDTNPVKEEQKFVDGIIEDIKWLEFDPKENIFYGSDYFDKLYEYAIELIKKEKAYVCDLSPEEIREYRGTLTEKGKNSPYRNRSVEENLELFKKMKDGEFKNGEKSLRAKIDMSSPNMNMRDPVIYRILHEKHYRTGSKWCIYPMYDYSHPLQDAIEDITHSMCSIEFKDHRPLYNWPLEELGLKEPPKQREFGRMNLSGVVTSKRYLRQLVEGGYVDGWDDPRLPTIKGLRRRGYTPRSIKSFLGEIGVSKDESVVDVQMLEHSIREDLRDSAPAIMAVIEPVEVEIENYPEGSKEKLILDNHPKNKDLGNREVEFSKRIYIEKTDFMEEPIKGFKRLTKDNEVRLRGAYFIRLKEVVKDSDGNIIKLICTYDERTKSGTGFKERKPSATIHWVNKDDSLDADVNIYDRLISDESLLKDDSLSWDAKINKDSLKVLKGAKIESFIKNYDKEDKFQFIRQGYFNIDPKYTNQDKLVINRIVPLKDNWKKKK